GPAGKWPQNLRVKRELLQSVGGRWRTCGNFFRGIQLVFHTMRCILRLYQSHRLCRMACRIGHAVIKFAIYDGPKLCKLEETILHIEDATAFLVDYICGPRPSNGYPTYGYEIYLPNVVASCVVEVERSADHLST